MKKLLIACLLLALGAPSLKADEGMWLGARPPQPNQ